MLDGAQNKPVSPLVLMQIQYNELKDMNKKSLEYRFSCFRHTCKATTTTKLPQEIGNWLLSSSQQKLLKVIIYQ